MWHLQAVLPCGRNGRLITWSSYAHIVHTKTVAFEWDVPGKAGANFRKHGVRLPEAIPVFDDPHAITVTDDESDPTEQRFITLGTGATGRLLVVVYTWRGESIRIISARPAAPREREEYEAAI